MKRPCKRCGKYFEKMTRYETQCLKCRDIQIRKGGLKSKKKKEEDTSSVYVFPKRTITIREACTMMREANLRNDGTEVYFKGRGDKRVIIRTQREEYIIV